MERSKIVVGALTAKNYVDRRNYCSESWLNKLNESGIKSIFVFGDGNDELVGNELHLKMDFPDKYDNLFNKVSNLCRWFLKTDCEYLFKCDDDTYIDTEKFVKFDPIGDYIGNSYTSVLYKRHPVDNSFIYNGITKTFCRGGIGYFLSRRSAEIISKLNLIEGGAEDCIVGTELKKHGIEPKEMPVLTTLSEHHWRKS